MKRGLMTKSDYHEVEIDVCIDVDDIVEFINDYATPPDLKQIGESLNLTIIPAETLMDTMKNDLFIKASNKYTLEELETKLGLSYL